MKPGFNAPSLFLAAIVAFFLPWVKFPWINGQNLSMSGFTYITSLKYYPNLIGFLALIVGFFQSKKSNHKIAFISACICLATAGNLFFYIIPIDSPLTSTGINEYDSVLSDNIRDSFKKSISFGFLLFSACSALLVYLTGTSLGIFKGSANKITEYVQNASNTLSDKSSSVGNETKKEKFKPISIDLNNPKNKKIALLLIIGALVFLGYFIWDKTRVLKIEDPYSFAMEYKGNPAEFQKKYINRSIEVEVFKIAGLDTNTLFVLYPKIDEPEGFDFNVESILVTNFIESDSIIPSRMISTELNQTRQYVIYSPERNKFINENDLLKLIYDFDYDQATWYSEFKYSEEDPFDKLNGLKHSELFGLKGYNSLDFYYLRKSMVSGLVNSIVNGVNQEDKTKVKEESIIDILKDGLEYMQITDSDPKINIPNEWRNKKTRIPIYYEKYKISGKIAEIKQATNKILDQGGLFNLKTKKSKRVSLVLKDVKIISRQSILDPMRKKTINLAPESLIENDSSEILDSTILIQSPDSSSILNDSSTDTNIDLTNFEDATTDSNGQKEGTINVDKTFIYNESDISTKTSKFLIRDDVFKIMGATSDFYYIEFTNNKSVVTVGWILKKDASVK